MLAECYQNSCYKYSKIFAVGYLLLLAVFYCGQEFEFISVSVFVLRPTA